MYVLFRPFLEICFFKRGPQGLPASTLLLALTLVAHTLFSVVLSWPAYPPLGALLAGILDTLVLAILTLSLLSMQGLGKRLVPTLSALAGSGALISALAVLPVYWLFASEQNGEPNAAAVLILMAMVAWSIAVMAHILRHSLGSSPAIALVIAVLFYWLAVIARNAVFPIAS